MRARWRGKILRSQLLVVLGSFAVIALIWAAAVERVRFEREQMLREVRRNNDNLALGFEQHTRRILRNVSHALAFVRYAYLERGKTVDIDRLLARGEIVRTLFRSMLVIDERGEVVTGWGEYRRENKARHAYFQMPRDRGSDSLFVGQPRLDGTGTSVIDFSQRVTGSDGRFAGVVVTTVDSACLAEFYALASMSGHDAVMVLGLDGVVRARRVGAEVTSGEDMTRSTLLRRQAASAHGALETRGKHGTVPRFMSYRTLASFPLIVAVGRSQAESMATFEDHRRDYLVMAAIASITVLVFGIVLLVAQSRKRRALGEVVQSESRFRAIFDQAFVGMGQHALDGTVVRVNQKICSMLGYAPEELLGTKPGKVTHPDDVPSAGDFNGEFHVGERRFLRKDGGVMWGKAAWTLVRDSEGRPDCYVSVVLDITEFKRIDQMKNEFISMVSHELRTPLTSIRGSLGLVAGGVAGGLPDAARNLIDIAKNNCERLIRLINDILDTEKIESGKMRFELEEAELGRLLEAAIAANEGFAAQHEVKLALHKPAEPVTVNVDSDRLTQVITNLLSNAVKFSPAGRSVDVTLSLRAGRVRVEVRDHGAGIPEEFRNRIFQKFSQADSSDTRAKAGTGLGLNISKAIVDRLGGVIGFDMPRGDGTIFYIELPVQRPSGALRVDASLRPRLLVCQHDPETARLVAAMLDKAGFDTDLAFNAADGHAHAMRGGYAAMTVDPNLPDRDGASLIRVLREEPRTAHLPILVVSAVYREGQLQINGETAPASGWMEMPIGENSLVQAVRHAIEGTTAPGHRRILHVEPDPDIQRIAAAIAGDFACFEFAGTLWEARARLAQGHFDLVLLELRLADGSGWNLVREIESLSPSPPVVVFSMDDARAQDNPSVSAMLVKAETSNERLLQTIRRVLGV